MINEPEDLAAAETLLRLAKKHLDGDDREQPRCRLLLYTILSIYPNTPAADEAAKMLAER